MKTIKKLLIFLAICISSIAYSQQDTCVADYCYSAVLDTVNNTIIVTFFNNSYATNQIVSNYWDFGDGSFDTAINPIHIFQNDSFIVRLDVMTSNAYTDFYIDTIVIGNTCNPLNQIDFLIEQNNINLFPTIVNYSFKIVKHKNIIPLHFFLYDELGRLKIELNILEIETEINRKNYPSGFYFYRITNNDKLIKYGMIIFE